MKLSKKRPLRPTQFAEQQLLTHILNGTYPPGAALPNERHLASLLGITRPTLRETLQRLSGEGWISIQHGKPTRVNDYWDQGGLKILGTMVKYGEHLPAGFITHLLEFRCILMPSIAEAATLKAPAELVAFLHQSLKLSQMAGAFAKYDWDLQLLMAKRSLNPIFLLIMNDFKSLYHIMASVYFSRSEARNASGKYYRNLMETVHTRPAKVKEVVRAAMEESLDLWKAQKQTKVS
jgi:GntR family negative regulator for fad regulon and positive regulator of fabA